MSYGRRWPGWVLPSSWPRPARIARRALARIRQEADRLSHLVDELLELTRAEGDPTARILEEVELAELLA